MTINNLDFRGRLGSVTSFLSVFIGFVRSGVSVFKVKTELFVSNLFLFFTFLKKNDVARELIELFGGFGGFGDVMDNDNEEVEVGEEMDFGETSKIKRQRERDDITKYPMFYLEEVRAIQAEQGIKSSGEKEGKGYEHLKTNFVLEKTPLGNVIMYYNKDRNAFEYYTDNIIPYRVLDTVARKYVLTYDCCELYIDMEKEIKEYVVGGVTKDKDNKEKKVTFDLGERDAEEEEKKEKNSIDPVKAKPNVFAKFKSYNKDSAKISDVVGGGAGGAKDKTSTSSNNGGTGVGSVVNTSKVAVEENTKILLKEKANVYTCLGKFANFGMLQKIDRAVVDKNYTMSFAEYKKMMAGGKK